jgi:ATP-dependent DNA helicase RecQ
MSGSKGQARYLRNNSSYPEVKLWNRLKRDQTGNMFKRQWLLDGYILDFYCAKVKLAIEVDGKIHEIKARKDQDRDLHLKGEGIHVLRISARSVILDCEAVVARITETCRILE